MYATPTPLSSDPTGSTYFLHQISHQWICLLLDFVSGLCVYVLSADQGENNMHNIMGNSAQHVGYGCQMVDLVATWRQSWSKVEGTTDPLAWFGAQPRS